MRLIELESLSQRNLDVVLSDEWQLSSSHSDEAGHQRVPLHTINSEEAVGVRSSPLTRALPHDIGPWQGQPILFFLPFARAMIVPGVVDLVPGEHLAFDGHRFLRGHRQGQQHRHRGKSE